MLVKMKWKFLLAVIVNFQAILGIIVCQWHIAPVPYPPLHHHHHAGVWEEHFVKMSRYPQFAQSISQTSQSRPIMMDEAHSYTEDNFFPPTPIDPMVFAEPDDDLPYISPKFFTSGQPEYSQEDPLYRLNEQLKQGNFKNIINLRPRIKGITRPTIKYSQQLPNKKTQTSINEKLPQTQKAEVIMEGASNDKNSGKSNESSSKTEYTTTTQRTSTVPIEITSYAMQSPNGILTHVTEMVYDVSTQTSNEPTTTPIINPFLPPSTSADDRATQNSRPTIPYINNVFINQRENLGKTYQTPYNPPVITPPTNDFPRFVTTLATQGNLPTPPPFVKISTVPSEINRRRYRKRFSTTRPPNTTTDKLEDPGTLSGAAIAGIIIGSLVSVALLSGK